MSSTEACPGKSVGWWASDASMDQVQVSWPNFFLLHLDRALSTHCSWEWEQLTPKKDNLHLERWMILAEMHLGKGTNWMSIWHSTVVLSPMLQWRWNFVLSFNFISVLTIIVLGDQFQTVPNQRCINCSERKEERKISCISQTINQFCLCNVFLHVVVLWASRCVW